MSKLPSSDRMGIAEARAFAIKNAADWVAGADWDQFWGQELADAAFSNSELATVLTKAQREVAARIRRITRV